MKNLICVFILLTGTFAMADTTKMEYGLALCEKAAFDQSKKIICENWVANNMEKNFYSIALNVCVRHALEQTTRKSQCFYEASRRIDNKDLQDLADGCYQNGSHSVRGECLRLLFAEFNNQTHLIAEELTDQDHTTETAD